MTGHWYVTMQRTAAGSCDCATHTETVELAIPAVLTTLDAIRIATEALPDWTHPAGAITWRASYDQRKLPANSQPAYQTEPEMTTTGGW